MTPYDPGEVVLVRFPFTDLSSVKKRPAVILSPTPYSTQHGDVVVLALTSQPQPDRKARLNDWKTAGLPKPTWIKTVIGTIAHRLVVRRIGRLSVKDSFAIKALLPRLVASEFLP